MGVRSQGWRVWACAPRLAPADIAGWWAIFHLIVLLSWVMGTSVPITLIVAPGPTINPKGGLVVGARVPLLSMPRPLSHVAIVWGRAKSAEGDEVSPQLIPMLIHLFSFP